MKKKIGIIGHFGGDKNFLDGQTVKTKILYQELKSKGLDIFCVDTYNNTHDRIKLLIDSIKCIINCEIIIILLSGNGMKIYFPMMYLAKKILKRKVFHDVIGGNLAEHIDNNRNYGKYLKTFDCNWVEFDKLKNDLEKRGIKNCKVIPNFKRLNTDSAHLEIDNDAQHKLCIFSRVMKEKGITDAIEAVHSHNESSSYKFILEIWGPIDDSYAEEFDKLISAYGTECRYMGVVDYNKSVETITDHAALLFPTFWKGEGFPGTIIDAYTAGLPVIARDWNANAELIDNFQTGWVYPNDCCDSLLESLRWIADNPNEIIGMREKAKKKAMYYLPERWIDVILDEIS